MDEQRNTILVGDVLDCIKTIPDGTVQCVVTSPPYFGLRDYGTALWEGGDTDCDHLGKPVPTRAGFNERYFGKESSDGNKQDALREPFRDVCGKCGARRIDKQIGLEKTPEEYVAKMVEVFREVRRVLRGDGTLWLNLGSSYASGGWGGGTEKQDSNRGTKVFKGKAKKAPPGWKSKDLIPIPWMVALALQADGWWLRSDIIWGIYIYKVTLK